MRTLWSHPLITSSSTHPPLLSSIDALDRLQWIDYWNLIVVVVILTIVVTDTVTVVDSVDPFAVGAGPARRRGHVQHGPILDGHQIAIDLDFPTALDIAHDEKRAHRIPPHLQPRPRFLQQFPDRRRARQDHHATYAHVEARGAVVVSRSDAIAVAVAYFLLLAPGVVADDGLDQFNANVRPDVVACRRYQGRRGALGMTTTITTATNRCRVQFLPRMSMMPRLEATDQEPRELLPRSFCVVRRRRLTATGILLLPRRRRFVLLRGDEQIDNRTLAFSAHDGTATALDPAGAHPPRLSSSGVARGSPPSSSYFHLISHLTIFPFSYLTSRGNW